MVVIGFDTATPDTAVAATRGGEAVFETSIAPPGEPASSGEPQAEATARRPAHASRLLVEVERAARAAGGWAEVDRIAVGVGPGTFTGLRIGVATGRALAQAHGLSIAAVGTLSALARGIADRDPGAWTLPVIDARRGEVFAALFDAGGEAVWEAFVVAPAKLSERIASAPQSPVAAGDGALRFRRELERGGALIPGEDDAAHRLAARHVCALGAEGPPWLAAEVVPLYLRAPDAERWRERSRG